MVKPCATGYKRGMDQATEEQLRAVTRAAEKTCARVRNLARACMWRARYSGQEAPLSRSDRDLLRAAADEMLALVDPEQAEGKQ